MSAPGRPTLSERRVVTVLFADMVDSTATAAMQDPEKLRNALTLVFDRAREILEGHGGTVEKFIGDAVMAVFGVPRAHDDDPERAVRAALALHQLAEQLSPSIGFPVRFRIGINTGEVAAGVGPGRDFLVTGQPVNVGARLYPAAEPGAILVGPLTHSLTSAAIRYDGDPVSVEGKGTGRVDAWIVDGLRSAEPGAQYRGAPDLFAPLVGRDEELAFLKEQLDRAARSKRPHLVTIMGEAGIGKSRLAREFREKAEARVLVGRCLPYGQAVEYHPIRMLIAEEVARSRPGDGAATLRHLRQYATDTFATAEATSMADRLGVLAGLLDPTAISGGATSSASVAAREELAAELRWAFRQFITRVALAGPLVVVLEDVHWASPRVLDLIDEAVVRSEGPVLFCCMARPELTESRAGWGTQGVRASTIRLSPLDPRASQRLVLELLRVAELPEELISEITHRAGGNPLFVEEVVRSLIATGHLDRVADRWRAAPDAAAVGVPETLRGVISARLDRLSQPARSLLQCASVFGRSFELRAARELCDEAILTADPLAETVRSGFIESTTDAPTPTPTYRFRHALIRDAVYDSTGKQRRRDLHLGAARWFETTPDITERGRMELRAHHLEQAYWLAEDLADPDRERLGRDAFRLIADLAISENSDHGKSVRLFDRMEKIALRVPLPLDAWKNEFAQMACARHLPKHGDRDQSEIFGALDRVRGLGPTAGLSMLLAFAAQHAGAEGPVMAEQSIAVARATGNKRVTAWALWLARAFVDPSDHQRNWRMLEEVVGLGRECGARDVLSFGLDSMAERAHHEGGFSRARELWTEAYASARESGVKGAISTVAMKIGLSHAAVHEVDHMNERLAEGIAVALEAPNPVVLATALWQAAWGEWQNGCLESGRDHAEECLARADPGVWPGTVARAHDMLARIYADLGDLESAKRHLNEVIALDVPEMRNHVRTSSARLAAAAGRLREAERLYRECLDETARAITTRLWGYVTWDWIRALTREWLADVVARQGRRSEAKELLSAALPFWSDPLAGTRRAEIEATLARLHGDARS